MRVKILPSVPSGTICAPPSKSVSHRLAFCAGLSLGESFIDNISFCEDTLATLDCLESLGVKFERKDSGIRIYGKHIDELNKNAELYCRESGSTLRFIIPLLWLIGGEYTLYGAPSLLSRPMKPYENLAKEKGLGFVHGDNCIKISGKLIGGDFAIGGDVSSQFITGLLFALPLLPTDSRIKLTTPLQSAPYVRLTLEVLSRFGVGAQLSDREIIILGNQKYSSGSYSVEGDYSGAAFLAAMNECGANIDTLKLSESSAQADKAYLEYFPLLSEGTPTLDVTDCPDLAPVIFALAGAKHGAVIKGTSRLKMKESDRAECMKSELRKLGITVEIGENECRIYGKLMPPKMPLYSHNDHRIAMALAVLLCQVSGEICGAEAVKKSYPNFFRDLRALGVEVTEYDV